MRTLSMLMLVLPLAGCLDLGGGGGSAGGEAAPQEGDVPACGVAAGVLNGAVYYYGPPGTPDSFPADSVDVLLTQGGPTYRVQTSALGTFSVEVSEGQWGLAPDVYTGCVDEQAEVVEVAACETADVELVIPFCGG